MANPAAQSRSFGYSRDALAFTRDQIRRRIYDSIFDHSPTLAMMFGRLQNADFGGVPMNGAFKEVKGGGSSITNRLNLGKNSTAKTLTGGYDTVSTDPADTVRAGWANWKHYSATISLSWSELLMNTGSEAISGILEHQTKLALTSLADFVGDHLFTSAGGDAITPISTLIGIGTADNVNPATYTEWKSRGVSARGTATPLFASGSFAAQGLADMRTSYLGATEGAVQPRVGVTTYPVFAFFEGSLQPQERYTNTNSASAGFEQLAFHGRPIFPDAKVPSGELYWLNPEYLKVCVLAGADFTMRDFKEVEQQEAEVSKVLLKCNTTILDRRLENKLTGITA